MRRPGCLNLIVRLAKADSKGQSPASYRDTLKISANISKMHANIFQISKHHLLQGGKGCGVGQRLAAGIVRGGSLRGAGTGWGIAGGWVLSAGEMRQVTSLPCCWLENPAGCEDMPASIEYLTHIWLSLQGLPPPGGERGGGGEVCPGLRQEQSNNASCNTFHMLGCHAGLDLLTPERECTSLLGRC